MASGLITPGREQLRDERGGLILQDGLYGKDIPVDDDGHLLIAADLLTIPEPKEYVAKAIDRMDPILAGVLAEDEDACQAWIERELELLAGWDEEREVYDPRLGFRYFIEQYGAHAGAAGRGWEQLDPWDFQWDLCDIIVTEDCAVVLKTRRAGFTLLVCHLMVWECAFRHDTPGVKWAGISVKADFAAELIATCRAIVANLPEYIRPVVGSQGKDRAGREGKDQAGAFSFPERGSEIRSLTTSATGARSLTGKLFFDEIGWYQKGLADPYYKGSLPIIEGGGSCLIGSSGNGRVGDGKTLSEIWDGAVANRNRFTPAFIAWWARPDRVQLHSVEEYAQAFDVTLDDYRSEASEAIRSDVYQEPWFRQVVEDFNGDEDYARQEYPACPEDALAGNISTLLFEPEWLDAVEKLGDEWDQLRAEGKMREPVGGLRTGTDWLKHTATVVDFPPTARDVYIVAELEETRVGPEEHARAVLEMTSRLPGELTETNHDAAGTQSIAAWENVVWAVDDDILVEGFSFSKWKHSGGRYGGMVDQIRRMVKATANGRPYGRFAVSSDCPRLRQVLRNIRLDDNGKIVKQDDHLFDAALTLLVGHLEEFERSSPVRE